MSPAAQLTEAEPVDSYQERACLSRKRRCDHNFFPSLPLGVVGRKRESTGQVARTASRQSQARRAGEVGQALSDPRGTIQPPRVAQQKDLPMPLENTRAESSVAQPSHFLVAKSQPRGRYRPMYRPQRGRGRLQVPAIRVFSCIPYSQGWSCPSRYLPHLSFIVAAGSVLLFSVLLQRLTLNVYCTNAHVSRSLAARFARE